MIEFHSVERGAGVEEVGKRLSAQGKVLAGGLGGVLSEYRWCVIFSLTFRRRRSLQFLQGTTTNEGAHQDLKDPPEPLHAFKHSTTPFSRGSPPPTSSLSSACLSPAHSRSPRRNCTGWKARCRRRLVEIRRGWRRRDPKVAWAHGVDRVKEAGRDT
jgi:hypothetical protein